MSLLLLFALAVQPAEVGTHLIRQAGQAVQQPGVIPEHFVFLGVFVDDVVVNLAPAFLKQGAALDLNVLGSDDRCCPRKGQTMP